MLPKCQRLVRPTLAPSSLRHTRTGFRQISYSRPAPNVALASQDAVPPAPSSNPSTSHAHPNPTLSDTKLPPVTITPPTTTYPPPHVTEYKPVPPLTLARLPKIYMQLSKARLTTLVVLTAMSGVALSPLPATLPVLLGTAAGTALCSATANTINQMIEVPFDAQMARTRNRPLVRKAITPLHAAGFAAVTGVAGPAVLLTFVNPLTAGLGVLNIVLYSGIYTRMKRTSIANTWVGAVVGAIPPVMGWTACNGRLWPSPTSPIELFPPPFLDFTSSIASYFPDLVHIAGTADSPLGAFTLFMLLFSWQFPHFNSLAHLVRTSYAQGGYKMLPVTDPKKNALVSLRHTALLAGVCTVLTPLSGLTTWAFAATSAVPNAILLANAWKFWRRPGDKEARRLWHNSLWWLPVTLALMMVHKQGASWLEWIGLAEAEKHDEKEKEREAATADTPE
ncbi:Protoheme IX farnesyltransferase, mitochondrial [Tulasnella sp. 424]|nr:Protoheme IX farnesyltransferase, mitochondrial [Tulasnella sp. 424]KAG8973356.1 Protoheme IX farnesyltransferase, mitochondrial [Tulasnella sp. 425]